MNSEQLLFNWQLGRDLTMRKVEEKWGNGIVEQLSLDLKNEFPDVGKNVSEEKLQQVIGEFPFPEFFAYVPWGHHIDIITKCNSIEEALFYMCRTIEEGWSRSTLQNCIKSGLYDRTGTAMTNFSERLPDVQSKLAQEITKDTYDLGFITLPPDYDEAALEDALEQNITRFLLEL